MQSNQTFHISTESDERLVVVTLSGMMSLSAAKSYSQELYRAVSLVCHVASVPRSAVRLLIDRRQQTVLPQDVVEYLQPIIHGLGAELEKTAVLSGTMLDTLQARRIKATTSMQVFSSADEARTWVTKS